MDPITVAAQRFRKRWLAFWVRAQRPRPATPAPPRALRVVVAPPDRTACLQTLRWIEWQPDNRHPFVILESPFESQASFLRAAATRLDEDLDALRRGLAADGLTLLPLGPLPQPTTAAALRQRLLAAGAAVAQVLDGLVVVLAPPRVADPVAYEALRRELTAVSDAAALRLVIIDSAPDAELNNEASIQLHFEVDQAALQSFLRGLAATRNPPFTTALLTGDVTNAGLS